MIYLGKRMKEEPKQTISEQTAQKLLSALHSNPVTTATSKPLEIAKIPVLHIKNSQIAAGTLGTVGLVTFALGIENLISTIPQLSSPYVEIAIGLVSLSISGLFLKKLT